MSYGASTKSVSKAFPGAHKRAKRAVPNMASVVPGAVSPGTSATMRQSGNGSVQKIQISGWRPTPDGPNPG